MPRDYKNRANGRKRRKKLSPVAGIAAGLLIGLFVAFLVYIKMQAPAEPTGYFQESLPPPVETTQPVKAAGPGTNSGKETPQAPPPPPKPRFDFYTLLPEMEVVVPDEEIPPPAPPMRHPATSTGSVKEKQSAPTRDKPPEQPVRTNTPATSTDTYLLQVGSFRNAEQAERFKAELALLGLETSIQKVTIDNKDTYHRVRVGPFHDTGALNNARSRLTKKGIESRVIKIRK